ncbi:MAG: MerR family DNA-binding protein [Sandaracinaceae bacterium]|nr:MerR family DNA-binding protein [Sandaracinaceae bacterium]
MREAGLSLPDIKHMFSLRHACTERGGASAAMTALLSERIGEVQEKILRRRRRRREELTAMASSLTECEGCPQGPARAVTCWRPRPRRAACGCCCRTDAQPGGGCP